MATPSFGNYIRRQRLTLLSEDANYSLRRVALSCGLEPSFLSKIERDIAPPPSESKIVALADALGEDADVLLAMAGKVSSDLQDAIRMRPKLFGELIRQLPSAPDDGITGIVKEAKAKYG
jgi:transcriptional regulator with XRE-family HTH domain